MYEGWLYQPGLERKRVRVFPAEAGLQLETPAGETIWAYDKLRLEYGGTLAGMVAIHVGEDSLYVTRGELLHKLKPLLPEPQQQALSKIMSKKRGSWRGVMALIGITSGLCVVAVLGAVYWFFTAGRELAVSQIPPSWESELGKSAYAELTKNSPACQSKLLQAGVASLEARIETAIKSPYKLDFEVVKAKDINAFALPGGRIALNAALVARAPSPEALAGVMAHESQHVLQRHGLRELVNQLGLSLAVPLILGNTGEIASTLSSLSGELLSLDFSRQQESDADERGLALLHEAGIQPQGMADFFKWLAKEQARSGPTPEYLSTHPLSENRQARLQAQIATLPKTSYIPLSVNWKALQAEAQKCLDQKPALKKDAAKADAPIEGTLQGP